MWGYLAKRLLLIVPTLMLASLLVFLLSKSLPSDSLVTKLSLQGIDENHENFIEKYQRLRLEEKFHYPLFYFSFRPSFQSSIPTKIEDYYEAEFYNTFSNKRYNSEYLNNIVNTIRKLPLDQRINLYSVPSMDALKDRSSTSYPDLFTIVSKHNENKAKLGFPTFQWHGLDNQYHLWISNALSGSFGTSLVDARPVFNKIVEAMRWTLVLSFCSLLITFLIAYPISIYQSKNKNSTVDKWISRIFLAIYSIPKFWLATLFILFFTTAEYGQWTNIFPSVSTWYTQQDQTFWTMLYASSGKFILPILVIVLPDVAYLSRLIRSNLIQESHKPYVVALLSKGLSQKRLYRKHLLPNTSIPIITLLAGVLPTLFSSSLIIEVIFGIPGVGKLMYQSIINADWAIVYPLVLFISVIAIVSFLFADLLILLLNPKVKLDS